MITLKEHLSASVNEAKNVPTGKAFKNIDLEIGDDELSTLTSSSAKHVQLYMVDEVDMRGVDVPETLQISPQNAKCQVNNLTMKGGTLIVDCDDNNGMIWFKDCNIDVDTIVVKQDTYKSNYIGPMFELSKVHTKILKAELPVNRVWPLDLNSDGSACVTDVLKTYKLGDTPIFDTLLMYSNVGANGLNKNEGVVITNDKNFKFDGANKSAVKDLEMLPGYKIGAFKIARQLEFDPGY